MCTMNEQLLNRAALEHLQLRKLKAMLAEIIPANRFYADKFRRAGVDPLRIERLADLAGWPVTAKAELAADQQEHPPYGTVLTYPQERYCRLHQTSGTTGGQPLRWLDTPDSWAWIMRCWEIIYSAIGLRPDDRLFFPFSFGPFIGFWAAFEGAARRGNLVLAGGGMTSPGRLAFMIDNRATLVGCTPTYALRLAEVARQEGIDLAGSGVRGLLVAGEPGGHIPATRKKIESAWNARVFDHTGMTEIGSLGIECAEDPTAVHLIESECIAEIVDPATGLPRPIPGEGELVLTNLGRWGSPLLRYRTGDLVRLDPTPCACGRHFVRMIGGILGRSDDMLIIRGNNVYPTAVEEIVRRFRDVAEFRVELVGSEGMNDLRIVVEPHPAAADQADFLAQRVARAIQNRLNFRPAALAVPPGTLPRFELKARRFVRPA